MTQKQHIFNLLDEGKTREEIEAATSYTRVTIGYYARQWQRGLDGETPQVIAPKYTDDFDFVEIPSNTKDSPKPTPETEKDRPPQQPSNPIPTPKEIKQKYSIESREPVVPFFREKQAK